MADWTNTRLNLRYRWKTVLIWGIGIVGTLVFAFWTMSERADAWVQGFQPFPKGEATVVLHRFCRTPPCEALPQAEWHQLIRSVITEWNNAGSAFRFHERAVQSTDDPCRPQQGHVYVLVADPAHVCPGDSPLRSSGRTEYDQGWSRVYISTWFLDAWVQDGNRRRFLLHLRRLLLHEFGHVVGLGHPDEAGQVYPAVMNGDALLQDHLTFDDIAGIQALYPVGGENPTAGILEIPGPNATVSGIGVISGWKCHAGELTVRFDGGGPIPLLYGAERKDVLNAGACGDADVGFVSIWNWGNLSDGPHVAVVYDDGVEFDRSTFTVVTTGEAFLQGASGECVVEDFPASGEQGRFLWNEATQHMELAEVSSPDDEATQEECELSHIAGACGEDESPVMSADFNALRGNWTMATPLAQYSWSVSRIHPTAAQGTVDSASFTDPTAFLQIQQFSAATYPSLSADGYDYVAMWNNNSSLSCFLYAFSFADQHTLTGTFWRQRGSASFPCQPSGQGFSVTAYRN